MACFLISAGEAVAVTAVTKVLEHREKKTGVKADILPFSRRLKWLSNLLWGGSALLAFEHLWHGEITPFFPFLTAAANPADTAEMLHEMATIGVGMAALITVVWGVMVAVSYAVEKRSSAPAGEGA